MNEHHFFATSVGRWQTTTDKADLRDLISSFERDGLEYGLWLVPGHFTSEYEIKAFRPVVAGATFLGRFVPNKA